jgi:hypothetical protein
LFRSRDHFKVYPRLTLPTKEKARIKAPEENINMKTHFPRQNKKLNFKVKYIFHVNNCLVKSDWHQLNGINKKNFMFKEEMYSIIMHTNVNPFSSRKSSKTYIKKERKKEKLFILAFFSES